MKHFSLCVLVTTGIALGSQARGADPRHPDWPCVQIKVPQMSLPAVWAGPPLDDIGNKWESEPKVRELVGRLAARRTPLEEAQKIAAEFVAGDAAGKEERGKLLFAGLFGTLNNLRSDVLNGIERFTRRQREFAERIRSETLKLRTMQDEPNPNPKEIEDFANQVQWDTRIFEDRRRTINYVCEVPITIERRLFALGRAIQQAME